MDNQAEILTKNEINGIREAVSYFQTACSDIAYEAVRSGFGYEKEIKKIKKQGGRGIDVAGVLADNIYNDAGTASDLIGDQLCDVFGIKRAKEPGVWKAAVDFICKQLPHLPTLREKLGEEF